MKLTKKDLRKIEINDLMRNAYKAQKNGDKKKLLNIRSQLSLLVSEAALRGFDSIFF